MAEWLEPGDLYQKIENIRKVIRKTTDTPEPNQCNHGEDHCRSIENKFGHLIPEDKYHELIPMERYFLLASPWILNLSWNHPIPDSIGMRIRSFETSREMLNERAICGILGIDDKEAEIFRLMIHYFDYMRDLEKCIPTKPLGKDSVRVRLLTAYLRLSDAIHVDGSGGPTSLFYFLENFDSPELFHWCKSKLKPTITTKPSENMIYVYFGDEIRRLDPSENVIKRIVDELDFHVTSVKNTLVSEGITMYLNTSLQFFDEGKMTDTEGRELEKLIKEFTMSFPPNAGTLQKLYLESIGKAVNRKDTSEDSIFKEIDELQNIAKKTHDFRPFHKGLERYLLELKLILEDGNKNLKKIDTIRTWINKCYREMKDRLTNIFDLGATEIKDFNHFLVFGFSSTVIGTMAEMYKNYYDKNQKDICVYVCEAHNKSRFDNTGRMRYIDGANYASQLKSNMPKAEINLIPDITLASIFSIKEKEKWAVLFGANGITREGQCGHTAGHLTVAVIAKHFDIPVYILCDTYKIGDLDHDRYMDNERPEQWLKTAMHWYQKGRSGDQYDHSSQLNSNDEYDLMNIRESIVTPSLISKIITEHGVYSIEQFKEKYRDH